jgi:glyoxylase-like metal-dependent hydrolase (beta-lactamase superfamily II)
VALAESATWPASPASLEPMGRARELAPGLHRWTAWHAEWREEVGCVAAETADGLVFFDPLQPPAELGVPAHVLVTVYWHARSAADAGAARVWASTRSARPLRSRGIAVSDVYRAGDDLPGGICALQTPRASEVAYWLPEHGALVVGDVLLGAGAKPRATGAALRLCPERWLGAGTHDDLRAMLRPLLALPVERVLPSHGEPVLAGARDALAGLLAQVLRSADARSCRGARSGSARRGLPTSGECA